MPIDNKQMWWHAHNQWMDMIFEVQRLRHVAGLEYEAHKDELNECMYVCLCVCFPSVLEAKDNFHIKCLAKDMEFMKKYVSFFYRKLFTDASVYWLVTHQFSHPGISFFSRIYNIIALIPKGLWRVQLDELLLCHWIVFGFTFLHCSEKGH